MNAKFEYGFEFVVSLTDFNNYSMPINQYLYMIIKDKRELNINKKYGLYEDYNPFIETSFDENIGHKGILLHT